MEGLLSTGPTPSSFKQFQPTILKVLISGKRYELKKKQFAKRVEISAQCERNNAMHTINSVVHLWPPAP